jgi:hypothetical protein
MRREIRYWHYSLSTEKAYVHWVRFFVKFNKLKHPREIRVAQVQLFLSHLANERPVSASTHRQALTALLFAYFGSNQYAVRKTNLVVRMHRPYERLRRRLLPLRNVCAHARLRLLRVTFAQRRHNAAMLRERFGDATFFKQRVVAR